MVIQLLLLQQEAKTHPLLQFTMLKVYLGHLQLFLKHNWPITFTSTFSEAHLSWVEVASASHHVYSVYIYVYVY